MVAKNTFYVIFGQLPTTKMSSSDSSEKLNDSGFKSLYTLGILQTTFEIALILYFIIASLVGFYNLPFFNKILPKYKQTSMRTIILNCAIFLIFSSALPVSSKILGLTRFDLLGHFGDLHWLANVHIILIYNFVFAIATGICLITKFTATVRSELYNRVLILFQNALMTKHSSFLVNSGTSSSSVSASSMSISTPAKNSFTDLNLTSNGNILSDSSNGSVSTSSSTNTSTKSIIQPRYSLTSLFKKHID